MIDFTNVIVALFFTIIIVIFTYYKKRTYFPGPEGNFLCGSEVELNSPKVHLHWVYWMKTYGLIFRVWSWWNPIIYVCDAKVITAIIEQKLPKHGGFYEGFRPLSGLGLFSQLKESQWKHDRKIISEALRDKNSQVEIFQKHLNNVSAFLKNNDHREVDFTKLSVLFTLDIIGEVLFDCDFKSLERFNEKLELNCPIYVHLQNILPELLKCGVSPWRIKIPIFSSTRNMLRHIKELQRYANEMIKLRTELESKKECLLDTLISEIGTTQSLESVRDHIITLAVAGCDPTANSIVFAMYELMNNPECQEKICKELEANNYISCSNPSEMRNILHRSKSPILNSFVNEVLRMHGPGFGTIRTCPFKMSFTDSNGIGIEFNPGDPLLLWNYPTHHSEKYYAAADKFIPERFIGEVLIEHGSYFPFSFGERRCLGENIALLEIKLVLAHFICHYNFQTKDTLDQQTCFTLAPHGQFRIIFTSK